MRSFLFKHFSLAFVFFADCFRLSLSFHHWSSFIYSTFNLKEICLFLLNCQVKELNCNENYSGNLCSRIFCQIYFYMCGDLVFSHLRFNGIFFLMKKIMKLVACDRFPRKVDLKEKIPLRNGKERRRRKKLFRAERNNLTCLRSNKESCTSKEIT